MTVPTVALIDAWLRVQLLGDVPNLPHAVSVFLAGARVRPADGEKLACLRAVCREGWRLDEEEGAP